MASTSPKQVLQETVYNTVIEYLQSHAKDHVPSNLHKTFLHCVEQPLCEAVLDYTQGNSSKAAELLGISRTTLSKKITKK